MDSAAPGAAVSTQTAPIDSNLLAIIEAWPSLPEAIKSGILAMARAAGGAK